MTDPLTYPPEIVIESTTDLPPEYDVPGHEDLGVEICCELAMVVVEVMVALIGGGS